LYSEDSWFDSLSGHRLTSLLSRALGYDLVLSHPSNSLFTNRSTTLHNTLSANDTADKITTSNQFLQALLQNLTCVIFSLTMLENMKFETGLYGLIWLRPGTNDHDYEAFGFHKIRRYFLTPEANEHLKKGHVA